MSLATAARAPDTRGGVWKYLAMKRLWLRVNTAASRHPALLKVLRWLNLHNPGDSINP